MSDCVEQQAATPVGAKVQPRSTRDCLDPWNYLEISASGDIRPCCNFQPLAELGDQEEGIGTVRNNPGFRALRKSLLSGELLPPCEKCHIRKLVPIGVLERRLSSARQRGSQPDILAPLPVAELRIDINEKCNLRCDYCAVSSPEYRGVEMDGALFEKVERLMGEVSPHAAVHVNGHGETTYHPKWMTMCRSIIEAGYRPHIITNLAKHYSEEEVDMLAKFSSIQVSLDSDDDELMRSIRKSVRTAHVFEAIERIRNAALRLGSSPAPRVSFSVGVYAPSIWTLQRFVERIIAFGVRNITFWNLVEMDHQKLVEPLRNLPEPDQIRARGILATVRRTLEKADVNYVFAGDFDSMVHPLTGASRLRSIFRRARRAARRHVFST